MPAITALTFWGACAARRAFAAAAGRVQGALVRLAEALKNRRVAVRLAEFDDRMLADIGLTRSDLRDAYAEPLWHDPTDTLARRAAERRTTRAARPRSEVRSPDRPASATWRRPPTDRPARYLV
jgi:uncharacterized protein YjiS (DUF1127 family)